MNDNSHAKRNVEKAIYVLEYFKPKVHGIINDNMELLFDATDLAYNEKAVQQAFEMIADGISQLHRVFEIYE